MFAAHTVISPADLMPARVAPAPDALVLLHRDDGSVFPCDSLSEALWMAEVLWPHGYLVSLFDCGSVVVSEIPA